MAKKIIVIGSGFGGLTAAIMLAAQGHEVQIFEKRDQPGGRAYQYEVNGFKFDGGPTVLTAPYLFQELFAQAGKNVDDYLKFVPLDPFYRIFDHQGRHFNYSHQMSDMLDEVERWSPSDRDGYERFSRHTAEIFNRFYPMTDQPFLHLGDMVKIMPDVIQQFAMLDMYTFVSRYIKNEFLRQVFSFHPLLIGGNPFATPSIFSLIVKVEKEWGVHYAIGGTGAVIQALTRLFEALGGKIHLGAEVKEIVIQNQLAIGIRLGDGTFIPADYVVSNGDVAATYRHLIPEVYRKKFTNRRIDSMSYSMSLFVIYFGTRKRYLDSKLAHHNILLNKNYRGLLSEIFSNTHLPDDFSLYLHMPSRTDASISPEGCESFYVLSPVPHLQADIDWATVGQAYRDKIMQFLEDNYLPDLQANIIAEHRIDPVHFQNTLNSYRGAAFSFKPSLFQSAWLRPHNQSEEFENLYFAGAGTHPGAGVPAVMSSGKIAANLIQKAISEKNSRMVAI